MNHNYDTWWEKCYNDFNSEDNDLSSEETLVQYQTEKRHLVLYDKGKVFSPKLQILFF